jgi:hypothetical protein
VPHLQVFIYLQLLDFLTTLVGLRLGLSEASPFIHWLMKLGPAAGLFASKVLAVALGFLCVWLNKRRLLHAINYWYAALVLWNLCIILVGHAAA